MNVPTEVLLAAMGLLIGVLSWIFTSKTKAYDEHLKECNDRREAEATLAATTEQRLCAIEESSGRTERCVGWLGNCMSRLGRNLNIDLPDRPE